METLACLWSSTSSASRTWIAWAGSSRVLGFSRCPVCACSCCIFCIWSSSKGPWAPQLAGSCRSAHGVILNLSASAERDLKSCRSWDFHVRIRSTPQSWVSARKSSQWYGSRPSFCNSSNILSIGWTALLSFDQPPDSYILVYWWCGSNPHARSPAAPA